MDEQEEREFYEQQQNMPMSNPTYNPIWSSSLANSKSKSTKWFARVLLVFFLVPFIGMTAVGTWGLINMISSEMNKSSTPD